MKKSILSGMPRASAWQHEILCGLGFARCDDGYRRAGEDLLFTPAGTWSSISMPWENGGDPLGILGRPGPWKHIDSGTDGRFVFPLPRFAVVENGNRMDADDDGMHDEEPGDNVASLESCIAWAMGTAGGQSPEGWEPPDRETIDAWTKENGLTVQRGSVVRQVELVHAPGRLALRVPLVSVEPGALPEERERWLRRVLHDAQNCWHLVRIGFTPHEGGSAAMAEVDLTGVPAAVSRRLFLASLDSLKWVVAWLVETSDFLVDTGAVSQALESLPNTENNNNK